MPEPLDLEPLLALLLTDDRADSEPLGWTPENRFGLVEAFQEHSCEGPSSDPKRRVRLDWLTIGYDSTGARERLPRWLLEAPMGEVALVTLEDGVRVGVWRHPFGRQGGGGTGFHVLAIPSVRERVDIRTAKSLTKLATVRLGGHGRRAVSVELPGSFFDGDLRRPIARALLHPLDSTHSVITRCDVAVDLDVPLRSLVPYDGLAAHQRGAERLLLDSDGIDGPVVTWRANGAAGAAVRVVMYDRRAARREARRRASFGRAPLLPDDRTRVEVRVRPLKGGKQAGLGESAVGRTLALVTDAFSRFSPIFVPPAARSMLSLAERCALSIVLRYGWCWAAPNPGAASARERVARRRCSNGPHERRIWECAGDLALLALTTSRGGERPRYSSPDAVRHAGEWHREVAALLHRLAQAYQLRLAQDVAMASARLSAEIHALLAPRRPRQLME